MSKNKKKWIHARVDEALHEQFKIKLIKDKKNIQDKIIEMIEDYLKINNEYFTS